MSKDVRCIFRVRCTEAQQVFLVGVFNNWSTTATPMEELGDGRWEAAVELRPGNYPYCYFVIDKAWFSDDGGASSPTSVVNTGSVVCVPHNFATMWEPSMN